MQVGKLTLVKPPANHYSRQGCSKILRIKRLEIGLEQTLREYMSAFGHPILMAYIESIYVKPLEK